MRSDKVALLLIVVLCALAARWLLSPTRANLPAPLATVHLLPLVGPTPPDLTEVQRTLEAFTGVQATLEKPVPLPASALQQWRAQYEAERLQPAIPSRAGQYWLAITQQDLFTSQVPQWRYCYGSQFEHSGVLSSARMGPFPGEDPALARTRLHKMVLRYVLEGAYAMKRVEDPKSLLFARILGPDDLDRMDFKI